MRFLNAVQGDDKQEAACQTNRKHFEEILGGEILFRFESSVENRVSVVTTENTEDLQ